MLHDGDIIIFSTISFGSQEWSDRYSRYVGQMAVVSGAYNLNMPGKETYRVKFSDGETLVLGLDEIELVFSR